jgi:hypothetical protein
MTGKTGRFKRIVMVQAPTGAQGPGYMEVDDSEYSMWLNMLPMIDCELTCRVFIYNLEDEEAAKAEVANVN